MKLEESFNEVYTKFKLHFYHEMFGKFKTREASLTTVETFCMETIYAMNRPTINEFASFIQISSPNAAYKVNNLIKKGYIKKIQSEEDKREYHLEVTQKYIDYYNISFHYLSQVIDRLREELSDEDQEKMLYFLNLMSNKLMPEIPDFKGKKE